MACFHLLLIAAAAFTADASTKTRNFGGHQGAYNQQQGAYNQQPDPYNNQAAAYQPQSAYNQGNHLGGALNVGRPNGINTLPGQLGGGGYQNIQTLPALIPSGGYGGVVSDTCRYWCKTKQGQYYCCENGLQSEGPVGVKPGECVPSRPLCPRFKPPQTCSNDLSCAGIDKCCFDTCLKEHVCKPPRRGTY